MNNKNNMETQFLPYTESSFLFEMGFNEECFALYQKNKKLWYTKKNEWITNFISNDPELLKFHIENYPKNVKLIDGNYHLLNTLNFTAPLYRQVFIWFAKKYNLIGYINPTFDSSPNTYFYEIKIKNKVFIKDGDFKSYEEAELVCIQKLINIAKNENNENNKNTIVSN